MSGVEILSIIEEVVFDFNYNLFWTIFFTSVTICLIAGITIAAMTHTPAVVIFAVPLGMIFGTWIGSACGDTFGIEADKVDTTYKVLISDEVSLNEFMEKYEIIDQEGKIYTVRERGE